jgi:hypothetical protein
VLLKKTTRNLMNMNEIESESDPECDIMKPEEMIKIYASKEKIYTRNNG